MIFIIEGPEGSGKTTLAQQISMMTGYPIVHRDKPKDDKEKAEMLGQYLQDIKSGKNMIYDRCWYSEIVYGPIMRDASVLTYPQMYELEQLVAVKGGMIIYCTGPKLAMFKRAQRRGEEYVTDKETHIAICDAYDALFNSCPHYLPLVKYEVRG